MKKGLIRFNKHMGPMYAVLERYNIGTPDHYHRGLWITDNDIPVILDRMKQDKTGFMFHGQILVNGTCRHNQVGISDFENVLKEV